MSYAFSKPLFGRCVAALVFCEKLLTEPGRTCLTISGNVSVLFWDHPSLANMSNLMDRITPAHAGKSCPPRRRLNPRQDHPRTRGEKGFHGVILLYCAGSPPHTRGKAPMVSRLYMHSRITPAHAGKRETDRLPDREPEDHPRTRGEKGVAGDTVTVDGRITPAHAGKREPQGQPRRAQ